MLLSDEAPDAKAIRLGCPILRLCPRFNRERLEVYRK